MPFMQTGDKGKSLATINFANPNEAREIDLPAPTPGHAYNGLYLIMDATVTAAAGAAARNGGHDVIDSMDIETEKISWPVENVRWYTLWVGNSTLTSFIQPAAVSAGAGGGASKSEIFIPCLLRPDMGRVTIRIRTNALAVHHTTATAVAGTVHVYADEVPLGSAKNQRAVAYREKRVDVLALNTDLTFDPQVVPGHAIYKALLYQQEVAGTLVDGYNTFDFILNGRYVVQPNLAWDDSQYMFLVDYRKTAAKPGVTIVDWFPEKNSAADLFTLRQDGTASVATSAILFHYLEA